MNGILQISEEQYHADQVGDVPSLSSSIAKVLIEDTALHAWTQHPKLNPNFKAEESETFDLGTIAHAIMLQGLKNAVILPFPDWRTKESKEQREAARAEGLVPILEKNWTRVQAMVEAGKRQLAAHKEAKDAFQDGKPEQTLVWTDDHGVLCRARLDWLSDDRKRFSDYKSTGMTANPDAISRSMFGAGWDVQFAFYRRGLAKLGFESEGIFVCQESIEPYALSVIGFDPMIQRVGDNKVQKAINLWAKCLAENKWPGYPDRVCYPEMPKWMAEMEMNKELEDAIHPPTR